MNEQDLPPMQRVDESSALHLERPEPAQQVTLVVTVAALGWIATVLAAVVLVVLDDVHFSWWIAFGAASLLGAVSATSAVRLRTARTRYLHDVQQLAVLGAADSGRFAALRAAIDEELKWALRTGDMEVAARLGEALARQPSSPNADNTSVRP